jgi:hypothetical protein
MGGILYGTFDTLHPSNRRDPESRGVRWIYYESLLTNSLFHHPHAILALNYYDTLNRHTMVISYQLMITMI